MPCIEKEQHGNESAAPNLGAQSPCMPLVTYSVVEELRAAMRVIGDARTWIARRHDAQGTTLTGEWTNEGDVVAAAAGRLPTHYLDLHLCVTGRYVSGIVSSRAISSGMVLPNGSFSGRRWWGRISGSVIDVRYGKLVTYGAVVLCLRGRVLEWHLVNRIADFLPTSAVLWKRDPEVLTWVREKSPAFERATFPSRA